MITINEIIDLFDSFWTTNKRMPGVIPKRMLENGTMYWEIPETFADKVHTWKDKKPIRFTLSNKDIDNVNDTDGIDVINFNLGYKYPSGLFVVQDGTNDGKNKVKRQNFKYVSFADVLKKLNL